MSRVRRLPLLAALLGVLALAGCSDVTEQVDEAQRGVDEAQRQVQGARDSVDRAGQSLGELADGDLGGAVGTLTGVQTDQVERLVRDLDLSDVSCPASGSTQGGGSLEIRCTGTTPDGERRSVPVVISPDGGVSVGD